MEKRYNWVDSLKGIAMLGVILVHCGTEGILSIPYLSQIVGGGERGVQLFFLISAFLNFNSFERFMKLNNGKWYKWVGKRFISMIPLYYLALVICIFFTGGKSYWLGSEGHISIGNLVSHLQSCFDFERWSTKSFFILFLFVYAVIVMIISIIIEIIRKQLFQKTEDRIICRFAKQEIREIC